MKIKWIDKIMNEELWRIIYQNLIENEIKRRNGIGLDIYYVKKQK